MLIIGFQWKVSFHFAHSSVLFLFDNNVQGTAAGNPVSTSWAGSLHTGLTLINTVHADGQAPNGLSHQQAQACLKNFLWVSFPIKDLEVSSTHNI